MHEDADDPAATVRGSGQRRVVGQSKIVAEPDDYRTFGLGKGRFGGHCLLPLAVQAPDFKIQQRCECDPRRERYQTGSGDQIEPAEPIYRRQDEQELRYDVQQSGKRIVQPKEQP
jgi:hypothetical protein